MPLWKIKFLDVTKSTNEDAKNLISNSDDFVNTVICADKQTSGKGRQGRIWHSPVGNIYASFIVKNEYTNFMSFVSAISIMDTLKEINLPAKITCKWPNDVLVDGKKISGILLEVHDDALIIGIGINVKAAPENAMYQTTAINDFGIKLGVKEILEILAKNLYNNIEIIKQEGFGKIRAKWLANAHNIGGQIQVNLVNEIIVGCFNGISEVGGLIVDTGTEHKTIMAGDVFYL